MKTKSIILTSTLLILFSAHMGTAFAGTDKYSQYKAEVGATKGTSASDARNHGNKYCRTVMEKDGLGGSILPSASAVQGNSKYSR